MSRELQTRNMQNNPLKGGKLSKSTCMKEFLESIELIEKAVHLYNRIENKKKDFGLGYKMSMKEIFTIQYIGDCPGIYKRKRS